MHETSAATILKEKPTRLRKEAGNPNLRVKGGKQIPISHLTAHPVTRPATFLILSLVLFLISLYITFNLGVAMLLFATYLTVFETYYGWSVGVSIDCAVGVLIFANLSDRLLYAEGGNFRAEQHLILMMWGKVIQCYFCLHSLPSCFQVSHSLSPNRCILRGFIIFSIVSFYCVSLF